LGLNEYSPTRKYSCVALQQDYRFLRKVLEAKHPSLYWYTSKDSMDNYFKQQYDLIQDSMTEDEYTWHVLSPLITKIRCGHTSVLMSKNYEKSTKNLKSSLFPIYLKIWNDTMAVTGSLLKNDSVFRRGTIIKSINGMTATDFQLKFFDYLSKDGYAENLNFVRVSSNFPYFYKSILGLSKEYQVEYLDSSSNQQSIRIPLYITEEDTLKKKKDSVIIKKLSEPRVKKIQRYRTFTIDSSKQFATLRLNTFSKGRLRTFFRKSFRSLRKNKIDNLIVDLRLNGGGNVSTSILLTKYLSDKSFKLADTVYSRVNTISPYSKYFQHKWLNNLQFLFISKKKNDGFYHLSRYEKKLYSIKKKYHYNGKAYVLISGPTFSASCLFLNAVKGQNNIKLIGEETGGGSYGNNGIIIPDLILPQTKIRIRVPLFRIIQKKNISQKGRGIMPDVYVPTSYDAIQKGYDKKMSVVKEMIYNSILK
jgi:hypothetical protein